MTDIEAKALALVNEIECERCEKELTRRIIRHDLPSHEALCRAIEQHEAFKKEVSREMEEYSKWCKSVGLQFPLLLERFIIPKPKADPLEEVLMEIDRAIMWADICAEEIRASLGARGWEIREKGQ